MFQIFRFILFFIFIFISLYFTWANAGMTLTDEDYKKISTQKELYISSIGFKKSGNVIGIQPYLVPADYSNPERLYRKLEFYLLEAKRAGYLGKETLVVFPEHIGSPLFLMNEKETVYTEKDFSTIKNILIYNNLYKFIWNFITGGSGGDRSIRSLYLMKSEKMKLAYESIFSKLASFYKIQILAGTIVLPQPEIVDGKIAISGSEIQNLGFLFDSDGKVNKITFRKKFASSFEEGFLKQEDFPADILKTEGFSTPYTVLLSKDSLYNERYPGKIQNSDLIISPALYFAEEKIIWQEPEISDNFTKTKSLFTESDKNLPKMQLWNKFGLPGKFNAMYTRAYLQIFFRGDFYGIKPIGQSSAGLRYNKIEFVDEKYPESILNIWL